MGDLRARILGRPGLRADLMAHVLTAAGVDVLIGEVAEGEAAPFAVALLVEPEAEHWDAARQAGHGAVLVVAQGATEPEVVAALLRGADAVVEADAGAPSVVAALEAVASGGAVLDARLTRSLLDAARAQGAAGGVVRLTPRENDILASIDCGHSVKQTARELGISVKTVENLQSRMFRKLEARNRAQAIGRAHALGLLEQRAG